MSFPKKINVPSAVEERNNFPLNHVHQTTSDFGLTQITEFMPLAPTDVVDIQLKSFAQLMPLIAPTMGNANLIHRAFFVPLDFISADWKSYISNHSLNADSASSQPSLPTLILESLCSLWFDFGFNGSFSPSGITTDKWISSASASVDIPGYTPFFMDLYDVYFVKEGSTGLPPEYYDYSAQADLGSNHYFVFYRFTALGKQCWNLFTQLGFNIGVPSVTGFQLIENLPVLPLFAICKIFVDNFVDARYNWAEFSTLFRMYTSEYWAVLDNTDKARVMHDILVLCSFAWFDNDLFTSAWQSHANPSLNGLFKGFSVNDSTTSPSVTVNTYTSSNTDPNMVAYSLSQHMLDVLKSVTSYFTRNNIAGSRPIDVLLARFNVKQPEVLAQMSQYLGSFTAPVKISEVVAQTAGNDGDGNFNALGDKGGQGTINSDGSMKIHFENKYFYGYLVVVSHIMPDIHYYQGLKPHVLMSKQFDFFTPEFDNLGSEAMPKKVLFADLGREFKMSDDGLSYNGNAIFGFVPRYYQYKFGFDTLSGDFRLDRYKTSLRPYQMFREVAGYEQDFDESTLQNNKDFRIFSDKARENYDKMFVSQSIDEDHFVLIHQISVNANRPMAGVGKSLIGKIEGGRNMVALNPTGKKI